MDKARMLGHGGNVKCLDKAFRTAPPSRRVARRERPEGNPESADELDSESRVVAGFRKLLEHLLDPGRRSVAKRSDDDVPLLREDFAQGLDKADSATSRRPMSSVWTKMLGTNGP